MPKMYFAFISLARSPRTVQLHSDRVAVRLLALLFAITSSCLHASPSPPTHRPPHQYQGQSLHCKIASATLTELISVAICYHGSWTNEYQGRQRQQVGRWRWTMQGVWMIEETMLGGQGMALHTEEAGVHWDGIYFFSFRKYLLLSKLAM